MSQSNPNSANNLENTGYYTGYDSSQQDVVIGAFYSNSFAADSTYTGLSCASTYNATSSFAQMTVYADEVYTTEKDGFELQEELIYIVLYNGQEYFATASYMESFNAGWGLLELVSENIYIPYSLYIIEELGLATGFEILGSDNEVDGDQR